jgi:hypothetical protein
MKIKNKDKSIKIDNNIYLNEIWKDLIGFEGFYKISNLGRIKSIDRYVNSSLKNQKSVLRIGKILKLSLDRYGYLKVNIRKNNIKKNITIHRAVALTFIKNTKNLEQVNHIDGNKQNNYVENLEWITNDDNIAHGVKNNLFVFGENHHNSKLTNQQVKEIKEKYIPKIYSSYKLAKEYGVSRPNINSIINGKTRNK